MTGISPVAVSYHYVAYVFNNNSIWEIDGRREFCTRIAQCDENNWINTMVGLLEASELQGNPTMSFLAVTQEYKLDIWKDQDLIYAILNDHTTNTRLQRLGEGPVVDDDLTDWEITLKEDYSALRRYKYDRNIALEIFRLNRELFHLHLDETEENVHENEFNEQYTSVSRPELYSLYAHIVPNGTDTPELSSEGSSTDQADND